MLETQFEQHEGYILSRHSTDVNGRLEMSLFVKTQQATVQVIPQIQCYALFTDAPLKSIPSHHPSISIIDDSYTSLDNQRVNLVTCNSLLVHRQLVKQLKQSGYQVFEEDIKPPDRYLMERNIRGKVRFIGRPDVSGTVFREAKLLPAEYQPEWKVWSLDIETSVSTNQLLSIGVVSKTEQFVLLVSQQSVSYPNVQVYQDEKSLLLDFIRLVKQSGPDIFIGWNLIGFDLSFIHKRCMYYGIKPCFGVNGLPWDIRESEVQGRYFITIPGRVALDGISLLKVGGYHFESYSLNSVSKEILKDQKLLQGGGRWQEIERMHKEDLPSFIAYNLQDCDLVLRIFDKLNLLELQQTRVDLTGIPLEQMGGSVAAFENLYLPRLHQLKKVAPAWRDEAFVPSPGGFVMSSKPGLYKQVLVFDFKSLYPSIIRTFCVDPFARKVAQQHATKQKKVVPGFLGAAFDKDSAILPRMVTELAQSRELAKQQGKDILSYAIKIIMNSFYGVLGSNVCRFYHAELASSITMRGHQILATTKEWMEEKGARVIYGDTDSLFITLEGADHDPNLAGQKLCEELNTQWQKWCLEYANLDSKLELEFETMYERFYMPTIRGSEEGSKKRYAGLTNGKLIFKGLEAARSDWTELARVFQRELFEKVFADVSPIDFIQTKVQQLYQGKLDHQLIYSKQLSRPLSYYTKTQPPHVRAARIFDDMRAKQGMPLEYQQGRKRIEYVYTYLGVAPYLGPEDLKEIDYQHYIDKQLAPIADSILAFYETDTASLLSKQMTLL
ncbi:DNA polymerase II [Marinomonas epiphytica]